MQFTSCELDAPRSDQSQPTNNLCEFSDEWDLIAREFRRADADVRLAILPQPRHAAWPFGFHSDSWLAAEAEDFGPIIVMAHPAPAAEASFILGPPQPTSEVRLISMRSSQESEIAPDAFIVDPPSPPDNATINPASAPDIAQADMPAGCEDLFSMEYVNLVGADIKETFTAPLHWNGDNWLLFGGVAAGVAIVYLFDEDIRDAVQRNHNSTVDSAFDAIEPFGETYSFAVLGGFYIGGELFHDDRAKSVGLDGLAASLIASGLITLPLKYALGGSRPSANQGHDFDPFGGNSSFPSGHTTQAFAVATVIAEHYDSIWVQVGAYTLASAVGFARMNNDEHWASDVLAGAAIGIFVGDLVVRVNRDHRNNMRITPIAGPGLAGVMFSREF